MEVSLAVKEFLAAKTNLSPYTRRTYRQRLGVFASWCKHAGLTLETIRASHVRAFIDAMRTRRGKQGNLLSNSTVGCYANDVKTLLAWAAREGEDLGVVILPTIAARVETPKRDVRVIETFSDVDLVAFFQAAESGAQDARDKALLSVLTDTGARASEVVGLTIDCVWLDPDDSYIKVVGKGKKEREIGLGRTARLALRRYITRYRKPRHAQEIRVFLSRTGDPLTVSGLQQLIVRLGKRAGVNGAHPHRFRHNFACRYLANGGDVYKLSRLLGHESVKISERYLGAVKSRQARQGGYSVVDHLKD
jgi:integrase/recombinase XerD